ILVSTSDTAGGAGVLHNLLQPLAKQGVSMTRIESRPSRRKKWDYVFFIDIEGHAEESPVAEALADLEKNSSLFRVLGAYPKAIG
ncbi:MAG: ACT domain-containing protein, partial [Gammaproteobacteria bacterium]|nr:ACT domain-containing protein [Gammaproteobacteria bacterium]